MSTRYRSPARLGVEHLEAREVPAVIGAWDFGGHVHIYSDDTHSQVGITRIPNSNTVYVTDTANGFNQSVWCPEGLQDVVFHGGAGDDYVNGLTCWAPLSMFGNGGNNTFIGGPVSNFFDVSYDANGNRLWYLFRPLNYEIPGSGYNAYADKLVVNGTTTTDIHQGKADDCYVLSAIASAVSQGYDLADRIKYLGSGNYQVLIKNPGAADSYQIVSLEGGPKWFEPAQQGQESWVIVYERAIAQAAGIDWANNGYSGVGTMPSQVMKYITGRDASVGLAVNVAGWNHFGLDTLQNLQTALSDGELVCASTRFGDYGTYNLLGSVTTPKLVGQHCYTVTNVSFAAQTVTLYNPWGRDGGAYLPVLGADGATHWIPSDGVDDGFVTVSFDEFIGSFQGVYVS
jgi:hypothetical protein